MNWEALAAGEVEPPFVPDPRTVNANSIGEVGEFNNNKWKKLKLTEEDEKFYEAFTYTSEKGVEEELLQAIIKQDQQLLEEGNKPKENKSSTSCCIIL